jgi:hypothetical protein
MLACSTVHFKWLYINCSRFEHCMATYFIEHEVSRSTTSLYPLYTVLALYLNAFVLHLAASNTGTNSILMFYAVYGCPPK